MSTIISAKRLHWRKLASSYALYLDDRGKALATVEPDAKYAGMWRVHMPDGWISDLANLSWAKEGAIRSALSVLNRKETLRGRAKTDFEGETLPAQHNQ